LRTRGSRILPIILYVAIGFFGGASGTYLFEHRFHASVAAFLGIAGILTGAAIGAGLNLPKLHRARRTHASDNAPPSRHWWDYRPRYGVQHHAALETREAGTTDAVSSKGSATTVEDAVWFDFVSVESSAGDVPVNTLPPKPYD
jgi:hypothetical protein